MPLHKFDVYNRWTKEVQFTAKIDCHADTSTSLKLRLAVEWARENGFDLMGANLSGANLSGADLRGFDLRGADLSDAYLTGVDLRDAKLDHCPVKIENIHQTVFEAASKDGALNMIFWHKGENFCGTTHCRAGWVTHLAGEDGRALELMMGTSAAAALIYMASDPNLEKIPNFYTTKEDALADMKRLAEAEAAR